jgi:hypothetical protein
MADVGETAREGVLLPSRTRHLTEVGHEHYGTSLVHRVTPSGHPNLGVAILYNHISSRLVDWSQSIEITGKYPGGTNLA